uniref:Uncharacterized protein n=1 Tax=Rhizophora mucronata TaxID=61149 RepID=A0A2P2QYR5_RHIMU
MALILIYVNHHQSEKGF